MIAEVIQMVVKLVWKNLKTMFLSLLILEFKNRGNIEALKEYIYNASTRQWTFINSDGTLNTAFKLSETQFKYLLETGVVK